ncbi:CDP-diacylglycerol--glycerol-3-phosphate 3-phosphatidyltransferase [Fusobacterium sp. PH5-44]
MSVYKLKSKFQELLMPICKKVNNMGITPNQITLFTMIFSIVFSLILDYFHNYTWLFLLVPIFFLKRMALNALDGMIATKFDKKTKLGIYFNEVGDIISDTVFFYCFFKVIGIQEIMYLLFIFLSIMTEYVGVISVQVDQKRHYDGPMGKSDRAVLVSLISLLYYGKVGEKYILIILIIGLVLLVVTAYNRVKISLRSGK